MRGQWGMSKVLKVSLQATIYSLQEEAGPGGGSPASLRSIERPLDGICCWQNQPISTAGKGTGRKSQCEPLAEAIMAKVEVGLSAQRIYQDLVEENGFTDSYQSVKRFVRKLRSIQPERVWRLECQPGEELQLDFGLGAPIDDVSG